MPSPSAKSRGRQRRAPGGYEKRDASAPWIFGIVGFLFAAGLAMHLILAAMMKYLEHTPAPVDKFAGARHVAEANPARPPFPRLQISPSEDLQTFRAREEAELNTYGWINKTAGVVRIPISRAMDLLLQRGLPTRSATNGNRLGPSIMQLQQQRPDFPQPEIQGD